MYSSQFLLMGMKVGLVFVSCVTDFLKKEADKHKIIDGSKHQNKNTGLENALLKLATEKSVTDI